MHLDFTIDLETLALTPNAAILQMGCVAWKRDNREDPFRLQNIQSSDRVTQNVSQLPVCFFQCNIDLRSCVELNLDFDQQTVDWWHSKPSPAKAAVLNGTCTRLDDALALFLDWVTLTMCNNEAESLCLWSQGSDFDISILRNVAHKCGMDEAFASVFAYTTFRDARTYILEMGRMAYLPDTDAASSPSEKPLKDARRLYSLFLKCEALSLMSSDMAHTSVYDAVRTSWQVWCIMQRLSGAVLPSATSSRS